MYKEALVFLCSEEEITRERKGYFDALSKTIKVFCLKPLPNQPLDSLLQLIPSEYTILGILHPEASSDLPSGFENSRYTTACFHIDTYAGTAKKMKWSRLFDCVFVFHPGYEQKYRQAGHPSVHVLSHAVERDLYDIHKNLIRKYDIGWVGRLDGSQYTYRRKVLSVLEKEYKMNDIKRFYNSQELSDIYHQSKIVVNISRNDYLTDANLRCFEVMASGALLITPAPSELSDLGFTEGVHFRTFQNITELRLIIDHYLSNEVQRVQMALLSQQKVLNEFTYNNRAQDLLGFLKNAKQEAPCRTLESHEVNKLYLYYYAKHFDLDLMFLFLKQLRKHSISKALLQLPIVLFTILRKLQFTFTR